MKTRSILALATVAGLAAGASGQVITTAGVTATFTMSWIENPAFTHNDNGVLEPGEHAIIRTTLSFTNQYQTVSFSPAIGAFTSGIVAGLGSGFIDIRSASADPSGLFNNGITIPPSSSVGPDANSAGTSGFGVRQFFRVAGDTSNGTQVANGFKDVQPGQFNASPSSPGVQYTNPITSMDRMDWTPNSYANRTVNFAVSAAGGAGANVIGLYLDLDGTTDGTQGGYAAGNTGAAAYIPLANITFANVNIPLAPAPSSLALLGLGGLIAGRRRR